MTACTSFLYVADITAETGGREDLFQHHETSNLPYPRQIQQLLGVQTVEAIAITGADGHEVVEFAGDDVALHTTGHFLRGFLEVSEGFRRRAIEHDTDDASMPAPAAFGSINATMARIIRPSSFNRSTLRRQAGALSFILAAITAGFESV